MTRSNTPDSTESKQQSASKNPYRKAALTKLLVISAVGATIGLFSASSLLASYAADKTGQDSIKPQLLVGSVKKSLEQFSFTTEQGVQYHIDDPNHILDRLARDRGTVGSYYELNRVRVKAVISKVGNYGHMGYYELQIIIVGLADS